MKIRNTRIARSPVRAHAATGKTPVTRYRCSVTNDEADAKLFDACWNSMAHPAVVSVTN